MVGQPLRLQPQQLQWQKEREKGKAEKAKAPDLPQEDAAKAEKDRTRHGQQVAQGPPVMNGRKPGNVHDSVANTPTHLMNVGRAPGDHRPRGKERAKAAASPPKDGLAARVLPNHVTSSKRASARTVINVSSRTKTPQPRLPPARAEEDVHVRNVVKARRTGPNPRHPTVPLQARRREKLKIAPQHHV